MKRKTFARLQTVALFLLLVEAMLLLALFLAQAEASADVGNQSGGSHKKTHYVIGASDAGAVQPPGGAHGGANGPNGYYDVCALDSNLCLLWGDAADIFDPAGGTGAGGLSSWQDHGANGQDPDYSGNFFPSGWGGPSYWGGYGWSGFAPYSGGGKKGGDGSTDFGSGGDPGGFAGVTLLDVSDFTDTDPDSDNSGDPQLRTLSVAVPEPWTAPLFLSGLCLVLGRRRRAA